jgi:molybdenum-dependent DNA-binding transcriptional regulator ModE
MFTQLSLQSRPEKAPKERFLRALGEHGTVRAAAAAVDVPFDSVNQWKRNDKGFAKQLNQLMEDLLTDKAMGRAMAGDASMLQFLLKSVNRRVYDDAVARTAFGGANIEIKLVDADGSTLLGSKTESSTDEDKAD